MLGKGLDGLQRGLRRLGVAGCVRYLDCADGDGFMGLYVCLKLYPLRMGSLLYVIYLSKSALKKLNIQS